jgi:thioredoxin 1
MSVTIATDKSFNELLSTGFNIVDFYTTTCVPCKMFSKVLEEIECEFPFVNIVKVNLSDYPKLTDENRVGAVPTVLFVKDGKELDRYEGILSADEVTERVTKYYYE